MVVIWITNKVIIAPDNHCNNNFGAKVGIIFHIAEILEFKNLNSYITKFEQKYSIWFLQDYFGEKIIKLERNFS